MSENFQHKELAAGRWFELSLIEQLANVGSEVGRAIKWEGKNEEYARLARERALELLTLTKRDPKNRGARLKEICRLYEVVVNDLYGFDDIKPDRDGLERYFNAFAVAANKQRAAARAMSSNP